jgi:hypothetical protein
VSPPLDVESLAKLMSDAAVRVLRKEWPAVGRYAETEFRKLGETVKLIAEQTAAGQISVEEAALLLDMQKNAMRSVLLTVEGIGILAAEQAINAALDAARAPINAAVGWAIV